MTLKPTAQKRLETWSGNSHFYYNYIYIYVSEIIEEFVTGKRTFKNRDNHKHRFTKPHLEIID